jgi:glycosyltransferase involved in cell wall biosynthesis
MAHPPARPVALENRLDRRIDAATDVWVTAAERASAALAAERAIAAAKIRTIHYGVAAARPVPEALRSARRLELGFIDGTLALTVIANFEPRKGIGVFLEALAILRGRGLEIRSALVGDGPLRGELERRTAELGLAAHVRFTGWRDDIGEILSAADTFALPSISHECLPYVILEAMAHGLPVVSTDVAGIPEMVLDRQTGRVVPPGDPVSLAKAIAELAADPDRRRAMGERGRDRAGAAFTLERMTDQMAGVLGLPEVAV